MRFWRATAFIVSILLAACAGQPPDRAHVATSGGEVTHDTSPPVQSPPWPRSFRGQQTTTTTAPAPRATVLVPPPPRDVGAQAATNATEWSGAPSELRAIVRRWFPENYDAAALIVGCESQWDPRAYNASGSSGLFQIHRGSWSTRFREVTGVAWDDGWFNPNLNTQFARWLYDQSGHTFRQWSCAAIVGVR